MQTTTKRDAKTADDITNEVLRRFEATPDARLRQIMLGLVRHLHAFVKEAKLNEDEWLAAIQFLTGVGRMCDDKRQEFILLSDTLGVSMVVDLMSHGRTDGATESTILGPFHRDGAPAMPPGGNIAARDQHGTPTVISGRVLDLQGRPVAGALLDVWQADSSGLYDSQYAATDELHMRGCFRTDGDGRFLVRTVRPVHYAIPTDGPVGRLLRATNRHPWRPGHVHFVVSADGYQPVTTHIFDAADPYLQSDAVFAVKDSLICTFVGHDTRDADAERFAIEPPFCTTAFDFVLAPSA